MKNKRKRQRAMIARAQAKAFAATTLKMQADLRLKQANAKIAELSQDQRRWDALTIRGMRPRSPGDNLYALSISWNPEQLFYGIFHSAGDPCDVGRYIDQVIRQLTFKLREHLREFAASGRTGSEIMGERW